MVEHYRIENSGCVLTYNNQKNRLLNLEVIDVLKILNNNITVSESKIIPGMVKKYRLLLNECGTVTCVDDMLLDRLVCKLITINANHTAETIVKHFTINEENGKYTITISDGE